MPKKIGFLVLLISVGTISAFVFAENSQTESPLTQEILPVDEGRYITPLTDLKDIDTVVYDIDSINVNYHLTEMEHDIIPYIDDAFEKIFLEAKSLKIFAEKNYKDRRKIHPNTLHISLSIGNRLHVDNGKTQVIGAISSKLTRGFDRQPLAHRERAMPYIVTGEKEIDEKEIENVLRYLIGHLPNYVTCANEGKSSPNCKGAGYNVSKMKYAK